MNRRWYRTAGSLLAGYLDGSVFLDAVVNVDPLYQHPAISPNATTIALTAASAATVAAGSLTGSTSGAGWITDGQLIYTNASTDYFQFTLPAADSYVLLYLTGILASGVGATAGDTSLVSGKMRNGGLAQIYVDTVLNATVDTYGGIATWTHTFLDGVSHVIKVVHSGSYGVNVSPAGSIVQTVGTSIAPTLVPAPPASFVEASWRIAATSTTVYSLFTTPAGGTESLVASGLADNTNDTTHVPGVTLRVPGPFTSGDGATFQTHAVLIGVLEVDIATSANPVGGVYVSAVVDSATFDPSGNPVDLGASTRWVALRWEQNFPPVSITFETSDGASLVDGSLTLSQDGSYASTTVTPLSAALASGQSIGVAGLLACPAGRYGRWTFTFSAGNPALPYFRNAKLYWANPTADPLFLDTIAGAPIETRRFDAGALALLTALDLLCTDYTAGKDDLIASYSVLHAVDQYLAAYGQALGLNQYTGEDVASYQTRIATATISRPHGGSLAFICAQVAQLVQGSPQVIGAPIYSGTLASVFGGGVLVAQSAGRAFTVTLPKPAAPPAPPYPGLPGLALAAAQQLITDFIVIKLRPLGSGVTLVF